MELAAGRYVSKQWAKGFGAIKWTTVRGFGHVRYFNISYIVLFAVPVLYELYGRVEWLSWHAAFPLTLKLLYAASVCYAIAIAIYQYRCPEEIRRFGNVDEYLNAEHPMYLREAPSQRLNIVLTQFKNEIDTETLASIKFFQQRIDEVPPDQRDELQTKLDDLVMDLLPAAVQRFLYNRYQLDNTSRTLSRVASFTLYMLGTLIVLGLLTYRSYGVLFESTGGQFMQIQAQTTSSGDLRLQVRTFDLEEFDAVEATLRSAGVLSQHSTLGTDQYGRKGRQYIVIAESLRKLEQTLGGQFVAGQFVQQQGTGRVYACREVSLAGGGPGCEDLSAPDDNTARTACALIAGNRNWLGGSAQPGKCKGGI